MGIFKRPDTEAAYREGYGQGQADRRAGGAGRGEPVRRARQGLLRNADKRQVGAAYSRGYGDATGNYEPQPGDAL